MKSKKMLKVFSLRTKEEILLAEDCNALFSTQSTLVKMVLADLLEHVHKPIPCGAMIHFNAEIYQNPATSKKVNMKVTIHLITSRNFSSSHAHGDYFLFRFMIFPIFWYLG